MRRLFFLLVTLAMLCTAAIAQAAQVTGARWGVDKDNVLRFVIDVSDSAGYAVSLRGNDLYMTVNADLMSTVPKVRKINSTLADTMYVKSDGRATVLQVPLKKTVTSKDYKVFLLKKDVKTNRPFRVVLDITADKKLNANAVSTKPSRSTVGTAPAKSSTKKQDVSSKAAKGNTKAKSNAKSNTRTVPKTTSTVGSVKALKATKPYRTSGGLEGKIITIDAGHGGTDPGAIGSKGSREKNITLPIAKNLKALLEKKGATVFMTRTTDVDVSNPDASDAEELQARVNVAEKNNSDLFISIHINSCATPSVGGIASYYYYKTAYDEKIARCIQKELGSSFGVDNRGIHEANFYVIKRSSMPATLLELCFISNPKEETLLNSEWFQTKSARVICEGIENYFD